MKHIYRIDHEKSLTHSWFVTVQRRGQVYHRHCTDSVYGGKREALEAAKVYRDTLIATLKPLTRSEYCRIKKKNNRSGISGITKIDAKPYFGLAHSTSNKDDGRQYFICLMPCLVRAT